MLRVYQNTSPSAAKEYYAASDYYAKGNEQELIGEWGGLGAKELGLHGQVSKQAFDALCDNTNPNDGTQLTLAQRTGRTVGYDMNWNAPKSLSLLFGLTRDKHLLDAFRESVHETMLDMEREMLTRVRKNGEESNRLTSNMVWAEFVHFTARPVDGISDPSLHAHMFVFNATHDKVENEWKAGQFRELKRDANYFEALFHSRLSGKLNAMGYGIVREGRFWELAGVERSTIEKFSRRTDQIQKREQEIEKENEERLAAGLPVNPLTAEGRANLGAKTRDAKKPHLTWDDLQQWWKDQLTDDERKALQLVLQRKVHSRDVNRASARDALHHGALHHFEREAVVREKQLLEESLRYGFGSTDLDAIREQYRAEGILQRVRDQTSLVTSKEMLAIERGMTTLAREGRGVAKPLNPDHKISREWLNADQQAAVRHVLGSTDTVMVIRGLAGTGKTTLTIEALEGLEEAKVPYLVVAPSTDASRGTLRNEGIKDADTLKRFLADPEYHAKIREGVLWIDEAGLAGSRDMAEAFRIAKEQHARVVLMGDVKQHRAVAAGEPLRLLETQAGLKPVEVRDIRRQSGKYKEAILDFANGLTADGFDKLVDLDWVVERNDGSQYALLAKDYADALERGERVRAISPTHAEGRLTTDAIRAELQARGVIEKEAKPVERLVSLNLTEAQRSDASQYRTGEPLVVQFIYHAKGFKRGSKADVVGVENGHVRVRAGDGKVTNLPIQNADRFQVYRRESLDVAVGDQLRITKNGKSLDGHDLNNGSVYGVRSVSDQGEITLANGWTLDSHFGHVAHGFVSTSPGSQGRTVERVFIAASSASAGAINQAQAYVSPSRGTLSVRIYTDSAAELRESMRKRDVSISATELMAQPWWQRHVAHVQRRATQAAAYASRMLDNARARVARLGRESIYER